MKKNKSALIYTLSLIFGLILIAGQIFDFLTTHNTIDLGGLFLLIGYGLDVGFSAAMLNKKRMSK